MNEQGIGRVATWVRAARDRRGWTQQELAARAGGMSISQVQYIEAADGVRGPTGATQWALEIAFGAPLGTLKRVAAGEEVPVPDGEQPDVLAEAVKQLAERLTDVAGHVEGLESRIAKLEGQDG